MKVWFSLNFFIIVIIAILANPQNTPAQVSIEYQFGFANRFQLEKWTPLSVIVENKGSTVDGFLEVIITFGSTYQKTLQKTAYSKKVLLPGGSRKIFRFNILIKSLVYPVEIRLSQQGESLQSVSLGIKNRVTEHSFALVLGSKTTAALLAALPGVTNHLAAHPPNQRRIITLYYGR